MKKHVTRKLLVSAIALVIAFAFAAFVPTTNAKAEKNAMGYELGFKTVATLDFTDASMIVNPKDETRTATVGELRYFDYAEDLLSIVDDANAKSGKAVAVASATDFPRTSFEVQSEVLYKFSYKVKMTDETKWKDSFGISPYINTYAKDENGNTNSDKGGKDFHRDYADVVYAFNTNYKVTEIYFATSYKTNSAGDKFVTINFYDSFANAIAKNERDSFTHEANYTEFCKIDIAFYMQGGAKTMSYELSDVELSAYSVIYGENESVYYDYAAEETLTKEVYAFEVKEENVIVDGSATDSASNAGKLVVNGKDGYLSIVDDADAKGGKAVQVKDAYDFPRLRVNTLVAGKPYKVSYKIKMIGEENWTAGGNLGITPYLNFTTYNPTAANWQPDNGGWDFHCGYKYVQNAFNGNYQTVEFYFDTVVENDVLTLNIYGDAVAYSIGLPTATFTFNAGYVEFAAFDIAFYTQGSNKGMAYNLADFTITTEEDPVVEPPIDEPINPDPGTSEEPSTSDEPSVSDTSSSEKKGCGGVIDGTFAALALCGLAVAAMKGKKN